MRLVPDYNTCPFRIVRQEFSHGRTKRVLVYPVATYKPAWVPAQRSKCIVVRFVRGGRMYAGFAPKSAVPARKAPAPVLVAAPRYGQQIAAAAQRALGNLNPAEIARRAAVLSGARAA